jgi:tetratricopeptide (TPR) repeat protein
MRIPSALRTNLWLLAVLIGWTLAAQPATLRADELRDGRAALQAGRLDDALRLFEQVAVQGSAEGRAGVGLVWLKRHNLVNANEAFELAEKMDNQLAMAHYGQAEVLRQQEKCEEAVPRFQRAVELDRRYPEAQLGLSDCFSRLGRYAEAVAAANRGLNWGLKWRPQFLIALGNIALARDSLRDAGIWYTTAAQESPDDPTTHRALGDFYVKRGTFDLAYPEYQSAVARDSGNVELHFALGQALFYGQRYDSALEEFQWVVARDPEFPAAQFALGDLLYRSGKNAARRYAEARAPLEKYVQLRPEDPKGWSVLGRTYYYVELADKDSTLKKMALEALDNAERLGDKTIEMYRIRARLHIDRQEFKQAAADYDRAGNDLPPEDVYRQARMLIIQKNYVRAESLYAVIVDRDSTSRLAGVALIEIGRNRFGQAADTARVDRERAIPLYLQAIDVFQRRISLDPNSDEAYYYIGLSYREMARYQEAIAAMRQAVALAAGKADRHFWLGLLYVQADSVGLAEQEFQRVVDLDGGTANNKAIALRYLGYFRLQRKDNAGAIERLEESVGINSKEVGALLLLSQGYHNSGNRGKAAENYRRVLALDPGNADARNGLKILEGGAR